MIDSRVRKREGGVAILITAVVLAVISVLALTGMRHTEQESSGAARARSTARTFYAADAGIEMARTRLGATPPDLSPINVTLANGEVLQSRTREEVTPQDLQQAGLGDVAEGMNLQAGAGAGQVNRVYRVTVTATSGGSVTEIEAKLSRSSVEGIGY